ncbi:TetR/AcrR family transcriptional regulator [Nocardia jiangsuensis]|uniref:TetR/AcrR family transcriptional regulator n=1 Tax=Nocardia jiangsuensis TaxID=1691563 RepID=A0ABV8DLS9_9NOCA
MAVQPDGGDDPRRSRSRARLLAAATALVESGGVHAVTVEAVTRSSRVARTTVYRHFHSIKELQAAALGQLLAPVVASAPSTGTLRDRLLDLVRRQAEVIDTVPLHLAALTWVAISGDGSEEAGSLRNRLIEQYRKPFDELLGSPEGRRALAGCDTDAALSQLFGPIVFAKLVGFGGAGPEQCTRIVDDFLTARMVNSGPGE